MAAGAAMTVLFTGAGTASAAPAAPRASASVPAAAVRSGSYAGLHTIADLSAQRLTTADLVAAAKYGTGSPIDDPAREKQVLDSVAQQARDLGADPEATVRIFRDQIEANKLVQRALFHRWDADSSQAPTERPDLEEVRKEINRVNAALVRSIADSASARPAPYCDGLLIASAAHVRHERQLDALHSIALARSLRSVCGD
ncbi:chorismate mutase [Streptomyces sp. NBC_01210]|uniref:chorismate mutase n=1 Tax=Streptomyces sp. NBC_01210 TaxID=2903774 RepID=UPI002E1385E7|nr:chorismate mutase [Streptomyces sp. NBC_01210]